MNAPADRSTTSPSGLGRAATGGSGTIPATNNHTEVGPLQASALGPTQTAAASEDASARHQRAITMRIARLEAGNGGFADLIEICHHHASGEQFTELSQFGQAAVAAIGTQLGELSVATFLGEIVPMVPTATAGFLMLADRERQALLNTGSVTAATQRAHAILQMVRGRAQADPSNAQAQRDLSVSYNKLGDLMRQVGDGTQAERFYRDALTIAESILEADDPWVDAIRGRLGSLEGDDGDGVE